MGVIWMDSVMDMRKPIVAIVFTIFLSSHATVAVNCQQRGQSTGGGEILGTLLGAALGASSAHKSAQALAPKLPSVQAFSRAGCLATKLVRRWAARIRLIISTPHKTRSKHNASARQPAGPILTRGTPAPLHPRGRGRRRAAAIAANTSRPST